MSGEESTPVQEIRKNSTTVADALLGVIVPAAGATIGYLITKGPGMASFGMALASGITLANDESSEQHTRGKFYKAGLSIGVAGTAMNVLYYAAIAWGWQLSE